MSRPLLKLIVVLGPTASGKTELAIELARKFNGEIVSADSRQIYKEMDIGTNKILTDTDSKRTNADNDIILSDSEGSRIKKVKPRDSSLLASLAPQNNIRICMVDIVNPDQEFTLAQYKEMAVKIINDIHKRGKLPFLVGGTGLYIQAIIDNFQIPKVAPNEALRKKLETLDLLELSEMLKKIDPQAAEVIDIKNKRRLIRALEVSLSGGKTFSSLKTKGKSLFDCLQIGIKISKEKLYEKINKRVDEMIEAGLVDEVKKIKEKYSCGIPSMNGIGYKEICQVLESGDSNRGTMRNSARNNAEKFNKAVDLIKRNTRRYSRRQMTWFRRDKRIRWVENLKQAEKLIKKFLKK